LIAFYDLWPGDRTGLFWKKETDKSGSKQVRMQMGTEGSIRKKNVKKEECKEER